MKIIRCTVCGYIYEDETPANNCPHCRAPIEKSLQIENQHRDRAAKQVIGTAKHFDSQTLEHLKMNFTRKCTEVGIYLAMSRAAEWEGYPELAEAYKRLGLEESEHAARFAQMLGGAATAEDNSNPIQQGKTECGAIQNDVQFATLAWQLDYGAIRNSVDEIARR